MSSQPRLAILLAFLAGVPALCQDVTGVITGTVTDTSGAVIAGATVGVTNAATGVKTWQGKSNASGQYTAPLLPVGSYDVTIEAPGFRRHQVTGYRLSVDERARIDAVLLPGDLKESVTVVGESIARLETESSSLGTVVNPNQVSDLPMANRDILNLLNLSAGVSSGGDPTGIQVKQLSINGSRTLESEFTINGVSAVGGVVGGVDHLPSSDSLREFKMLTSAYSAEYGRTAGATINLVVDSGTNRFHGSLYEYFRNEDLNANNFFRNLRGQERAADRQNQFGGKIGGPVHIPKLYRGNDRTFFFFNYEGTRRTAPGNPISSVPTDAFRSGDMSASRTIIASPDGKGPFPGNRIPASLLDPAAQKIMKLLPAPNATGTFDALNNISVNNYVLAASRSTPSDDFTGRVDHSFGYATRVFGHLNRYTTTAPAPSILPGPVDPGQGANQKVAYNSVLGLTRIFTPNMIGEFRLGFLRFAQEMLPPSLGLDVKSVLGIQSTPAAAAPGIMLPGWTDLGMNSNTLAIQADNIFQWAASTTWVRGSHTVKWGAQMRKSQLNTFNPSGDFAGTLNFNGEMTSPSRAPNNPVNVLADFLLGKIKTASYTIPQPINGRRNYTLGLFVQDDWKITRRLTFNLGLRGDHESSPVTSNGMYSRLDSVTGRLLVAGKNASANLNLSTPRLNPAPRAGLAYSPNPKTVVRAGFGIFFGQIFSNLGGVVPYPGFSIRQTFGSLGPGVPQAFSLAQGLPLIASQTFDPFQVERNATLANPLTGGNQYGDLSHLPTSMQWNFGVQRELARGMLLDVNYVGSRGVHLPLFIKGNTVDSFRLGELITSTGTSVSTQQYRPFPTVSSINNVNDAGSSVYHSLQVRTTREMTRSLSFLAVYTYSRSIDDGSGLWPSSQPIALAAGQFPQIARGLDRGLSAFDRTHAATITARYTTHGPKWMRGFSINPVFSLRTGLPITVSQTNLYPDVVQQRPDAIGPISQLYTNGFQPEGDGVRFYRSPSDPSFPLAPTGPLFLGTGSTRRMLLPATIGTLGRDVARVPGDVNLNLSVNRRFHVSDKLELQLRADAFNALNHTNFNAPAAALAVTADPARGAIFSSPEFGLITTARSARFLQMVARIEF